MGCMRDSTENRLLFFKKWLNAKTSLEVFHVLSLYFKTGVLKSWLLGRFAFLKHKAS